MRLPVDRSTIMYSGLVVIMLIIASCGGGGGGPTTPSGPGTLTINLTDSPFSTAKAVLVTFSEVSAHRSDGPFFGVPFAGGATTRTCDLKKLMGAQDVLGAGSLPPGHYTQLRLVVASGVLFFDNPSSGPACAAAITTPAGASAPLEIPSGEVKLNREFDVSGVQGTAILLDFDGDHSVRETGSGKFIMTPVIAVVSVQ